MEPTRLPPFLSLFLAELFQSSPYTVDELGFVLDVTGFSPGGPVGGGFGFGFPARSKKQKEEKESELGRREAEGEGRKERTSELEITKGR